MKLYTTKKVSEITGLTKTTILYYEKVGIIGPINRDSNGGSVAKLNL